TGPSSAVADERTATGRPPRSRYAVAIASLRAGSEASGLPRSRRCAALVTMKPGGTGIPAAASSPRLSPLPPTTSPSLLVTCSNVRMSPLGTCCTIRLVHWVGIVHGVFQAIEDRRAIDDVVEAGPDVDAPPLAARHPTNHDSGRREELRLAVGMPGDVEAPERTAVARVETGDFPGAGYGIQTRWS